MTFKDLTPKKKIEHIWEYYRVHIGLTLLVIVILGVWIYDAKLKPHKELFSGVAILNYHMPKEDIDAFYNKVNSELGLTDTNSEAKIEYFYDDDSDVTVGLEMEEKFYAMLLSGDVNVIITDEESMEVYASEDMLLDLSEVYSGEELEEMDGESLLLSSSSHLVPEEKYYAVSLKDSSLMTDLSGYDVENSYIGIFGETENRENQRAVADVFLGKNDSSDLSDSDEEAQ